MELRRFFRRRLTMCEHLAHAFADGERMGRELYAANLAATAEGRPELSDLIGCVQDQLDGVLQKVRACEECEGLKT